MSRYTVIKIGTGLLAATITLTAILTGGIKQWTADDDQAIFDGITLSLTAEARSALQQAGDAFPSSDAGFSAYYRVPDGSGGFSLDKQAADDALFNTSTSTIRRSGPGTLIDIGDNYTVGMVRIINISGSGPTPGDAQTTEVNLYYDDQGWIVAYFPRNSESSRAWQAEELNTEEPNLDTLSRTTLLDAINDVLEDALGQPAIAHEQLEYYHWQYPDATSFLMFGSVLGATGSKFISFAIPSNFTVSEASVAQWSTETISGSLCDAETILDGSLVHTSCGESFLHSFVSMPSTSHNLELRVNGEGGAAGSLVMLIYSKP